MTDPIPASDDDATECAELLRRLDARAIHEGRWLVEGYDVVHKPHLDQWYIDWRGAGANLVWVRTFTEALRFIDQHVLDPADPRRHVRKADR